jgi:hypothetical protein
MKKTLFLLSIAIFACKKEKTKEVVNTVPAFHLEKTAEDWGKTTPQFTLIAGPAQDVLEPRDLDFHPNRPNELWILNRGDENFGGNSVIITNAGQSGQSAEQRRDGNAWHFMAHPSAMSFSKDNGNWGTGAEIQDANRQGGSFTGPSLWSSDLNVYAVPSGGNGSHLDMLHGSPYSMGIEWHSGNAFWVYDAFYKCLCFYDFAADHGPGAADHSDGRIHRYFGMELTRQVNVPSHMVLDAAKKWLYIADPANGRILRMDVTTGSKQADLNLINEPLAEHWRMQNEVWETFTSINLKRPSGIEIVGDILYVSDNETGEIIAYNINSRAELARINTGKPGIMGIKANTDGKLWFVNATSNEVFRIDPK